MRVLFEYHDLILFACFSAAVCDELASLTNGNINYGDDMTSPYSVSTVATYVCNPGYELNTENGNEMRTCERNDGPGSGADFDGNAPVCDRKWLCTHMYQ